MKLPSALRNGADAVGLWRADKAVDHVLNLLGQRAEVVHTFSAARLRHRCAHVAVGTQSRHVNAVVLREKVRSDVRCVDVAQVGVKTGRRDTPNPNSSSLHFIAR